MTLSDLSGVELLAEVESLHVEKILCSWRKHGREMKQISWTNNFYVYSNCSRVNDWFVVKSSLSLKNRPHPQCSKNKLKQSAWVHFSRIQETTTTSDYSRWCFKLFFYRSEKSRRVDFVLFVSLVFRFSLCTTSSTVFCRCAVYFSQHLRFIFILAIIILRFS